MVREEANQREAKSNKILTSFNKAQPTSHGPGGVTWVNFY